MWRGPSIQGTLEGMDFVSTAISSSWNKAAGNSPARKRVVSLSQEHGCADATEVSPD